MTRRRIAKRAWNSPGRPFRWPGTDPNVLCQAAYVLGYFSEELDVAIALLDRGLELNPSFARGWQWSGWLRLWAGKPDLAVEHFQTSLRLNPREQRANPFMGIGVARFARRLRRSQNDAASIVAGKAELGYPPPISCRLLRAFGSSRRGAGNGSTAAHSDQRRRAQRGALARSRVPRVLPIRFALGRQRSALSRSRGRAAILAADVAGWRGPTER